MIIKNTYWERIYIHHHKIQHAYFISIKKSQVTITRDQDFIFSGLQVVTRSVS